MDSQHFFSPGKLLLSSEYFVLDGALALAVPTKPGQDLTVKRQPGSGAIHWEARHQSHLWLNVSMDRSFKIIDTNLPAAADFIRKIFSYIKQAAPQHFDEETDLYFNTNLGFPPDFGLGSSSTLMANLARWAGIDAFSLNEACLGGSGYDVAVALENSAVLFQKNGQGRSISPVDYAPSFRNNLILIHLNKKQDSRQGIAQYRAKAKDGALIDAFTELTKALYLTEDLDIFSSLMAQHEGMVADLLGLVPARQQLFPDCPAFVKSLGAWGGDFVLSTTFPGYKQYFLERGYPSVFTWEDMVR